VKLEKKGDAESLGKGISATEVERTSSKASLEIRSSIRKRKKKRCRENTSAMKEQSGEG
jgi:hypothetical protein